MFESFADKLGLKKRVTETGIDCPQDFSEDLFSLFNSLGGLDSGQGVCRLHTYSACRQWSLFFHRYFPRDAALFPFAFDWQGRQFCLSGSDAATIYLLDPADLRLFQLDQHLVVFHDEYLAREMEEIMEADRFLEALQALHLERIADTECLGHRQPLFLGGRDEIGNLEVQDLEVYREFQAQLWEQLRQLPEGTRVGQVRLER